MFANKNVHDCFGRKIELGNTIIILLFSAISFYVEPIKIFFKAHSEYNNLQTILYMNVNLDKI